MTTNAFGLPDCPDCGATFDAAKHLTHAETCPIGLDVDATSADDARWFADHPRSTTRRRPLRWCERDTLAGGFALPDGTTFRGDVLVTQLVPGVRVRSFGDVFAILPQAVAR